ncbi:DNA-binding transcriptional activator [Vibrio chagasii]|nr:DNA-binding transcriptional activator [Vibrio chagasii]CAH7251958.1 DNA-binding transcriptional activator [Vibrio chagasii]CAH7264488.1 DNA-binding transcriptional activator [Vibrio chagasii]CAH7429620.1 DNA-binding transcriptional activator [Vibrio chagasii]CAH7468416.1 DNA-binding transcriptional activator [Vibrio chagasii]
MKKERIQYSFDVWLFIPDEDKLIMDNEDVIIDNRLSKLLDFFCQNPNIVFSRDELINEVWNGSILTDQVITQAIFELRKTLKSAERHSMGYIITVPKRGYKLDVEVQKNVLITPSLQVNTVSIDEVSIIDTDNHPPQTNSAQSEPSTEQSADDALSDTGKVSANVTLQDTNIQDNQTNTTPSVAASKSNNSGTSTSSSTQFEEPNSSHQTQNSSSVQPKEKPTPTKPSPLVVAVGALAASAIIIAIGVFWWWQQSPNESYNSIDSSTLVTTERAYSRNHASDSDTKSNTVTNHQVIEEHKAHATVHYLSLEPRYIYVRVDENLKNNAFMRGIVHKLMSYVTTYRNFRIIVDETLVPNSANVVSFKSKTEGDREYLDITYFNRISNFKHLGRDYLIDASSLHSTMRTMLDDLLDSFNIDIQKTILKQQISELPRQEVPLRLALESLGLTFMTLDRTDTLKKIVEANELEPDNHFLMSSRYLYELADIFLLKSSQKEQLVKKLNNQFGEKLLSAGINPTSYRVYDALAAYSLTQDNPNEAERYMTLIPRNDYNVMSTIILAKLEESKGNPAAAEEYYYETILESGYPVVLKVAQTLFFNSNISEIESKLEVAK